MDYDDDDDYDDEGETYDQADDLAEHTMPSPPWLDSDPIYDLDDLLDDWLLDGPDDYFDQHISKKRKFGIESKRKDGMESKSRGSPVTIWRTQDHDALRYPVVPHGSGIKTTVLKDWRDRKKANVLAAPNGVHRGGSKTAFAVVVERRPSQILDLQDSSLTIESKGRSQSKTKNTKPSSKISAGSALSKPPEPKRRRSVAKTTETLVANHDGKSTLTGATKRKAPEPDYEEDVPQAENGEPPQGGNERVAEPRGPAIGLTNGNTNVARGKKRKAPEPKLQTRNVKQKIPKPNTRT